MNKFAAIANSSVKNFIVFVIVAVVLYCMYIVYSILRMHTVLTIFKRLIEDMMQKQWKVVKPLSRLLYSEQHVQRRVTLLLGPKIYREKTSPTYLVWTKNQENPIFTRTILKTKMWYTVPKAFCDLAFFLEILSNYPLLSQ